MKPFESIGAALVTGALLLALSGCENHEGPAEKAGKQLDTAVEDIGEKMDQAGDEIKEAVDGDKR
ncbi:hypothetical protein [Endothiovibrio diazotrophicus]